MFYVQGRRGFRPLFSFSLFLVPCIKNGDHRLEGRPMSLAEIRDSVKTVWPLATAYELEGRPTFKVSGPLGDYLAATASPALDRLDLLPMQGGWEKVGEPKTAKLSLRQFAEATFFALAAQMTRGPGASIGAKARRELGDRVLTSLSASRVSSVAVVEHRSKETLDSVSREISRPLRVSDKALQPGPNRLDRDLLDRRGYEIAVLPADRCVVTVGNEMFERGRETSTLLEAGWAAYMVIGAATATGLIRNIFREIAVSDRSRPDQIAEIEREAMIDLHETYDLEIAVEAYRHHYQQLRKLLGITAEYGALRKKLEALHRETSTRLEGRSELRLTMLTWATAILSAVIAVGTLVLIFKGG
jgi:hypothetical protein